MQGVVWVLLGWLLGALPAQSHVASRMVIEHHDDACANLSPAECCAQMLEIAVFRATGDQVPKAAKTPVRLSCADPDKTFAETSCRLIAMSRGFKAHDANEICAPASLTKRCNGDPSCKQCMSDLDHLEWKASQRACYALTYVVRPNSDGTRVVTLNDPNAAAANGGTAVRVRRTVVP
jgi:hypothetical protein